MHYVKLELKTGLNIHPQKLEVAGLGSEELIDLEGTFTIYIEWQWLKGHEHIVESLNLRDQG